MGATEELARFIVETPAEGSPASILHEGKRCFINYFAVALYASRDPSLDIILDVFRQEGGKRHASVVGASARTTLQNAAPCLRLNGVEPERARGTIRRTFLGRETLDASRKLSPGLRSQG